MGRALADAEWRTLANVAEVLLEGSPLGVKPQQVADGVERFLLNGRSRKAWRCRALLTLLEHATLVTHGRAFSRLSHAERRQLVEDRFIGGVGVWALCAKVRYLVLMGAYGHEDAPAATGFIPLESRARFQSRAGATPEPGANVTPSLLHALRPRPSVVTPLEHGDAAKQPGTDRERTVA